MKYIKTFEESQNLPVYPFENIRIFISWFRDENEEKINDEGWDIFDSDFTSHNFSREKNSKNKWYNGFWQVQRIDDIGILESDLKAEKLAKKHGLMLDNEGVVIGYKGVSFLEHPEELEIYKNLDKYNL